jgi:hypothetical protein
MSTNTIDSVSTTEGNPEDLDTLYERMMEESRHRQRPTVGQRVRGVRGCDKGRTGSVVELLVPRRYSLAGEEELDPAVTVEWDGEEETDFLQWCEYAYWTADG